MSIINLPSVKDAIFAAVEKAIEECAEQHDYNMQAALLSENQEQLELYSKAHPLGIHNAEPVKLNMKMEFFWPGHAKCTLFCQPIIDLEKSIR